MGRTENELRDLSGHVLWHVRQFCRLGAHLKSRHDSGQAVLHDAAGAAALESFLIHARALSEFLARSRRDTKRQPRATDGLAEDYFDDPAQWRPAAQPDRFREMMDRVGWGVLHVS